MSCVLFAELAAATEDVRSLSGRKAKVARLAEALRGLDPGERLAGAGYLAGAPRQRVLGVGWASLRELPPEAVARIVATALIAERPRTRYVVGRNAQIQAAIARVLPGRAMDKLLLKRIVEQSK
jgi:hypothetical protein